MATASRSALFNDIGKYAKAIHSVTTWRGTKKPFGHIHANTEESYVYEFWCYLRILNEINLDPNQKVKLVKGIGKFPAAPSSKKENWSYYEILDSMNNLLYMACAGTGIKRPDAPTVHHPDISFQLPSASKTDDPSGDDIEIILDSKYVYPEKKDGTPKKLGKIKINMLSEFAHIVEVLLRSRKTGQAKLNFGLLTLLNTNALLSNAAVQDKHKDACKIDSIKQAGEFDVGKMPNVIP